MTDNATPVNEPDYAQRIEALSAHNRRQPSPRIEAELADLRVTAGRYLCQQRADAAIARPVASDLFQGTSGLPEIHSGELNQATLAAGLLHHGALIVREFYSKADITRLHELADRSEQAGPWDQVPHRSWAQVLFPLLELYRDNGLLEAVTPYLDHEPVMLAERTKLRQHRAGRDNYSAIPWHQDVNFFGRQTFGVNCWAAVTGCGDDRPGLGFIPCRAEQRYGWREEDGIAPLDYGNAMPAGALDQLSQEHPPVYPVLQPGDALLFDEMTVHRTAPRPWKEKVQRVTISWFFRAAGFPGFGTPLAVANP